MNVVVINNHVEEAIARLRQQYKGKPLLEGMIRIIGTRSQTIEDALQNLEDTSSLYAAEGDPLDQWGIILQQPRNGLIDDQYRLVLLGQVAVNVSQGTPEDLIEVFRLFFDPDYVSLNEIFPANVQLTAIGGSPIGSIDDIKSAVRRACPAGVSIDLFTSAPGNPFVFLSDPDPQGRGFGDANDPDVGGFLVSIF